ncbi:hypothetical protein T4D_5134 [Trichinella pseudospiralis]|uniref:Uncharacterized protein n=1 Tax=Trichinella pseudospiralis TaxID=6337 RepID=A0A0V1FY18_TRIPS|nr:hypothetical protein T4D_5134 [Trichinella pseudospiralis]
MKGGSDGHMKEMKCKGKLKQAKFWKTISGQIPFVSPIFVDLHNSDNKQMKVVTRLQRRQMTRSQEEQQVR